MIITLTPNPPCECGCGNEVSRPTNRFILGHGRPRKMTDEQIAEAKDLRNKGVSTYRLAKKYGVSQTWICYIDAAKKQGAVPPTAAETVRFEQIEIRRLIYSISRHARGFGSTAESRRISSKEYLEICHMFDEGKPSTVIARNFGRDAGYIRQLKHDYLKEKVTNEKSR